MDYEEKEYLTKEKYEELKKELNFLITTRRKEIANQLEFAKSLGDLSENAEYHEAREQQAISEDRIRKIESVLKNAEIISGHKKNDVVEVGSTVIVKKEREKENKEFTLVGSEEADTALGKISHNSPLGHALRGMKKGEEFVFQTPNGSKLKYKVISIK